MQYGTLTIDQLVAMAGLLNGQSGIDAILANRGGLATAKCGWMTLGQNEALVNILGGREIVEALLRGEKSITLSDAVIKLFDKHGRRIPHRTLQAAVTDASREFYLNPPNNNYAQILSRLQHAFKTDKGWPSVGEFQDKVGVIDERLKADEQTAGVLNGFGFDFCIPQTPKGDLGKILGDRFIAALGRAYKQQVGRPFTNYRHNELAGKVSIVHGSPHDQLVERVSQEYVIGKFFPCLQGFSVHADREQMETLPDVFLLNGGYDTASCLIAHADNFGRDSHTLGIDFAALQWRSAGCSLYFRAIGFRAKFGSRGDLGDAGGVDSAALVVLG